MLFTKFRSMAMLKKLMALGALLAVSMTGMGAMNNAYADWSATAKADAWFLCEANCQAGGIGPMSRGAIAQPPEIGTWQRTVAIKCKTDNWPSRVYLVSVRDKNWAGLWKLVAPQLTQGVNDSGFPVCR